MDEERIEQAMSRIEAALARIETTAAAPLPGAEGGWNLYRGLKGKVRNSVAELDALIAELER